MWLDHGSAPSAADFSGKCPEAATGSARTAQTWLLALLCSGWSSSSLVVPHGSWPVLQRLGALPSAFPSGGAEPKALSQSEPPSCYQLTSAGGGESRD